MANVIINEAHLTDIADAIRSKNGTEDSYKPREMAAAIEAIQAGGSEDCNGMHIPEEALHFTGSCQYLFSNNNFIWILDKYGDRITTDRITNSGAMFYDSNLVTEIPFDINLLINSSSSVKDVLTNAFKGVKLSKYPKINLEALDSSTHKIFLALESDLFKHAPCNEPFITKDDNVVVAGIAHGAFSYFYGEEEPTWLLDMIDCDAARANKKFGSAFPVNWSYSYRIKAIPSYPKFWNDYNGSYTPYYNMNFNNCCNLQEIVLPRPGSASLTSTPNGFNGENFSYCASLKKITFDVQEDGTPYTANWKNVTFNTCPAIANGINGSTGNNMQYLNPDKCVTDDESYQRLKNDSEYWVNIQDRTITSADELYQKYLYYSAFNHDAALALIKSLPDASAYGTNTLKLRGNSGEGTDGGAINTLTEEEIAVAAAKGWTVTFA